ncbi:hypothetical protein [Pleionea sediminis]|uniref:hypothetical protein n=1 Tax=Pleionea sediminis TaxID=2569479 RepID=UPI001186B1BA|nr:hypothetical protein [Pleionea sediminis]
MAILLKFSKQLCTVAFAIFCITLSAEPYISVQTQMPCSSCHVNPTGGGMRTDYGIYYGANTLPASQNKMVNPDIGKISSFLKLGGDFRYNFDAQQTDVEDSKAQGFSVNSAQTYLLLSNEKSDWQFYLDQQVAPGGAINREALLIKKFDNGDYVKVGKMVPAFGLKLEDDLAFTRRFTGINFDSSDNGVEYGFQGSSHLTNLFITNGTNAVENNNDRFQIGARTEWFLGKFRVGGAIIANDSIDIERIMYSMFAGYVYESLTFLAEIVTIDQQTFEPAFIDEQQDIALFEVNWLINPGHNLKFTEEFYDPDKNLNEDHFVRHSLVYEFTPTANVQIRGGFRINEAPPQELRENGERIFAQLHFYF